MLRTRRMIAMLALGAAACDRGTEARTEDAAGDVVTRLDESWSPERLASVKGVPAAQIQAELARRLDGDRPATLDDDQWGHAKRLYRQYGNRALWLANDGLHEERAEALAKSLLDAHEDALRLNAYPIGAVAQSLAALRRTDRPTAAQLAETDLLLTTAYVALAEDLMTGQVDPKSVSQSWFIDPQEERVDSALVKTLREAPLSVGIARMRPQDEEYQQLRQELLRLRKQVTTGDWPKVPAGKPLKPGEASDAARMRALEARLRAEGLLTAARDSAAAGTYDRALAGAVALYQSRHGIPVDSILGAETVQSLNVPVSYRLGQVAANLERHRWLPRTLGERYVLVNVPAFRVEGWQGGKKEIEMKVIVGAEYEDRATPVFSDSMEVVVFRPYWNVTPDIQAKEMAPKIAADPGYMARGNYEYWSDGGETRIRQRPGPKNSLGLVKFLFPNSYNIYLHDTPDDDLFEKDVRAFSHGCIRLEKPAELAQWVLGWDAERVRQAMEEGTDNRTVKLPKKIPVYIAYFTAYLRDGQLHYGNDLYDRDDKLLEAVGEGAIPRTETVQALEALRRIAERS